MTPPPPPPPTRRFCDWAEPLLPAAARLLVDHYGSVEDGVARMDGAVVALPGARAGRRLKELLLEVTREAGIRLVPPRTVTLGALPELLYPEERPFAPDLIRGLAWAEALRAADRDRLSAHFTALPAPGSHTGDAAGGEAGGPAAWMPLARELSTLARTVAAGGHRFDDVARVCGRAPFRDDADRWRLLARVQDDVERRLAELGYADRDLTRCRVAAEAGPLHFPDTGDLWLVGLAELPRVLHGILARVPGERLHAVIHAPETRADDFDALGCIRPDVWSSPERHLPLHDHQIHVVDRPGDQADVVVRILADLDGAFSSEDIALGVPDGGVVPALEERMERSGAAVRDAAGRPLSRMGPYRLLQAVSDFLTDRGYDALAALVRHPDLAPWLGHPTVPMRSGRNQGLGWLSALDRWYGEHLPARMVGPYPDSDPEKGSDEGRVVAHLMARLDELLRPLGEARSLSEWPGPVLELLTTIYSRHEISTATPRGRALTRALEQIGRTAEGFTNLAPTLAFTSDGATFLRLLLLECRAGRIPHRPEEDAVEMLGWLELHLDDTPVTLVTGVNEGSLPASVRGDAFLPDSLRGLLGLEDDRQRYARDLYRMTAMLHSREVLHLVAGRRSAAGDPLRPSRLLFAADDETVTRRVRRFFGGDESGEASGAAEGLHDLADGPGRVGGASEPAATAGFVLPPERSIDLGEDVRTVSVTEFRRLLEDPWSWALVRRYRAETENDHGVEMDGAVFGSLAHDVLERLGRREVERHARGEVLTDAAVVWKDLEEELDRQVAARFGPRAGRARVAVRLQVEQLRSRLRAFAAWHAGRVAEGWRVKAVELSTPEGGVPFEWGDGSRTVGLRARIDRVDLHPATGRWAVFDYKTGDQGHDPEKTHRKGRKDSKEWIDLQLPLYHWLLPRIFEEAADVATEPERAEVGFILLPRELENVGAAMADWDAGVLSSGVERARRLLDEYLQGPISYVEGRKPRWPDPEMEALTGRTVLGSEDADDEDDVP